MSARGFTLIEVLIASALLAVALLATAGMMITAYGTVDRSGEQTAAVTLGEQRLEWLRNRPFASGALVAGATTETLTGTYAGWTRTTTIADDTPRAGVKRITVRTTSPSGVAVDVASLRTTP